MFVWITATAFLLSFILVNAENKLHTTKKGSNYTHMEAQRDILHQTSLIFYIFISSADSACGCSIICIIFMKTVLTP